MIQPTQTAVHVHRWVDVTGLNDLPEARFMCADCGERTTDPDTVATVEAMEALPVGTKWVGADGSVGEMCGDEIAYVLNGLFHVYPYYWADRHGRGILPAKVVWRPKP